MKLARPTVWVVCLALAASSTGAALAIHLLAAEQDHDSHQCELCQAMLCRWAAVLDPPTQFVLVSPGHATSLAAAAERPAARWPHSISARGPPRII